LEKKINNLENDKEANLILNNSTKKSKRNQEDDLKKEFKLTIDSIKSKYENVIEKITLEKNDLKKEIDELKMNGSKSYRVSSLRKKGKRASSYELETRKELEKLLFQNSNLRREKLELEAKSEEYVQKIKKLNESNERFKISKNEEL